MSRSLRSVFILNFFLFSTAIFGQVLSSALEKNTLALGEVGSFKVTISDLQGKDVVAAPKNELLPFHFEEISDKIDKQTDIYTRSIDFAIFEEGKFKIPALVFRVGSEEFKTIPYDVEVINTAQKGDQINDIMKNKEVSLGAKDYWQLYKWYILGALILMAIIIAILYAVRYGKRSKNSPVVLTNQTLKDLEALRKKKFIENGDYRSFYVALLDISRGFLTRQYGIAANVLLTDDLVAVLKQTNSISPDNEHVIADIFQRGDLVKFAKTFPDTETMNTDFQHIRDFVKHSAKDLEAEKLRSGV